MSTEKPDLKVLFDKYVSDKSKTHAYHVMYQLFCDTFRDTATAVFEMGVYFGASHHAWQDYFPPGVKIIALDVAPECRERLRPGIVFELGRQDDPEVLGRIVKEHGPFDMVVDDASHYPINQQASFDFLWPHVKEGGLYVIEDVQMVTFKPRRFNKAGHQPMDEHFKEKCKKLQLGRAWPLPSPAVTFYRNAIFVYKPVGCVGFW